MKALDYKILIGLISVVLVFVGYGPYIRDIVKRRTIPHTFTFLVWGIASSITWALQVYGGAGAGAWITFAVSAVCIFIFFLCFKYGEKKITNRFELIPDSEARELILKNRSGSERLISKIIKDAKK